MRGEHRSITSAMGSLGYSYAFTLEIKCTSSRLDKYLFLLKSCIKVLIYRKYIDKAPLRLNKLLS